MRSPLKRENNRPTFYTQKCNQIRAGGLLFAKVVESEVYLLLCHYKDDEWDGKLEDFGGKTDVKDTSIQKTIYREVDEETNGEITQKNITRLIKSPLSASFYTSRSKYFMYLTIVDENFFPNTEVFGSIENHTGRKRTIQWYKFKDVMENNTLAERLRFNRWLIKHLTDLSPIVAEPTNEPKGESMLDLVREIEVLAI